MTTTIIFDFDRTIATLTFDWTNWRTDIKTLIDQIDPNNDIELENIRHANQNELIIRYGDEFRQKLNIINERAETKDVLNFEINKFVLDFIANTDKELYCWSSNSRKTLDTYLTKMNIIERFKNIVSREDVYLLKPDAQGFNHIYDKSKPKTDYLFVGDSEADEVAAEKAGISFIHVDDFDLKS